MNFILQVPKIDLGDTPIENIFITDFMPLADGTYVKVYLLGYKYAQDKEEENRFNNETIAKNLKIPLSDVLNAWNFWEKEGIIKKHETDDEYNYIVEFVNLKQHYIDNVYKYIKNSESESPEKDFHMSSVSNEELIASNRDAALKNMHTEIEKMFGRPLTLVEKRKIVTWQKQYELSPEMMIQAFSYCINTRKVTRFSYIETVIAAWHDEGITDIDKLADYFEKHEDRQYIYYRISKALGFNNRKLTEGETKTIDKWIDDYKFSMEMILKCLENSTKINNPNINYFDSILESWYKKGYTKLEDLANDKKTVKKVEVKPSQTPRPNKFHNFDQRTQNYSAEQLEMIGRRNFEKKLKELGLSVTEDNK